jgi:hypothetical protein
MSAEGRYSQSKNRTKAKANSESGKKTVKYLHYILSFSWKKPC